MKKVLLAATMITLSFGSTFAQGKKLTNDKTATTTTAPATTDRTNLLKFNEETHDFGTVTKGTPTVFEFTIKNMGKEPLVIQSARSTCGCTVPTFSKEPIGKKKSGVVKVSYDSNRLGTFSKPVTIVTNYGTKVVNIKGNVVNAPESSVPGNTSMIRTK